MSLALGAEASFVARTIDFDRRHLTDVLRAAAAHRGSALVEIYQNCPIYNDGAFDAIKGKDTRDYAVIPLVHGEPVRFGTDGEMAVVRDAASGALSVSSAADVDSAAVVVHDAHAADPSLAFALSRLTDAGHLDRAPIGIFRSVDRPAYDDLVRTQLDTARQAAGDGDLVQLLLGADTWTVGGTRS